MSRATTFSGRVGVLALGVSLGACATKQDLVNIQAEVRTLAVRQDSATQVLARQIEEANRAVMDSVRVLSDLFFEMRGDVSNRLLAIQDQQLVIGEILGQSQRSLASMREEQSALRRRLDDQLTRRPEPGDTLASGDPGAEESVPPDRSGDAEELYDTGRRQLERGNFNIARMAFEDFIEEYPNSDLAPSAYLHLGELVSEADELEEAVGLYLKVPELFPTAEEVPDALYRAGALCIELEDYERARQYLERVVNTYPDHRNADLARGRLEDIP